MRVSCTNCANQILLETAKRNGGLCGVCNRRRTKPSALATLRAVAVPDPDLEPWLDIRLPVIEELLTGDLRLHAGKLSRYSNDLYGYAILAEDYTTIAIDDPPSVAVAYNCESDIDEENRGNTYYRFSPDEWQSYVHVGFKNTNAALRSLYLEFFQQYYIELDQGQGSSNRGAIFNRVHQSYLNCLRRLRTDGTFADDIFLIIWIPCCSKAIIHESAKGLNRAEVYGVFASDSSDEHG